MNTTKGFTLIELIVVITLISIVSAVGMGLFSSTDQYSARLAADRWLAGLRLAQRLSLQKQSSTNLLVMTINASSSDWSMSIDQASTNLSAFDMGVDQVTVHVSTVDFASTCSALPVLTYPYTLHFNGYGNLVSAGRVPITSNTRMCFVAAQTKELCISPSGYAYEGVCDD